MEVGDEDDMLRQHHRLERLVDLEEEEDGFQANCTFIGLWGRCPCSFRRLICMLGLSFPVEPAKSLEGAAKA